MAWSFEPKVSMGNVLTMAGTLVTIIGAIIAFARQQENQEGVLNELRKDIQRLEITVNNQGPKLQEHEQDIALLTQSAARLSEADMQRAVVLDGFARQLTNIAVSIGRIEARLDLRRSSTGPGSVSGDPFAPGGGR